MARKDARNRLIEVAVEMMHHMPIDAISTRELAKRVGVSQPALYAHFKGLDQLLALATDHIAQEFLGFTEQAQARLRQVGAGTEDAEYAHFLEIFHNALEHRTPIQTYLKRRMDPGMLGERLRLMERQFVDMIDDHIGENLRGWGVPPEPLSTARHQCSMQIYAALRAHLELLLFDEAVHVEAAALLMAKQTLLIAAFYFDTTALAEHLADPTTKTPGVPS